MKFPFDFSIKLIFRMIFPGMILAAAMAPASDALLARIGLSLKVVYSYPFAVVAWGWVIVVCDMGIYMLFEGRRYWPHPIRHGFIKLQQLRLGRLLKKSENEQIDPRRRLEAEVELRKYPVNADGDPYVEFPTRLGNIIEEYETYSLIKYGISAVFYWYRLWVVIDKDLRDEIDNAQSVVDSTVYISFSLYLSGVIMFAYAGIDAAMNMYQGWSWLSYVDNMHLPYVPAPPALVCMGLVCLIVGFFIYRLTLTAHASFGELFKSVFDMHRSKLDFADVVTMASAIVEDPSMLHTSTSEKYTIAWRYLRWHRIRAANGSNYTPKQWKELLQELKELHEIATQEVAAAAVSTGGRASPPSGAKGGERFEAGDASKTPGSPAPGEKRHDP